MINYIIIGGIVVLVLFAVLAVSTLWSNRPHRKKDGKSKNNIAVATHPEDFKSDTLLDAIEDGVVFIDQQGIIQVFNPGAANITGWPQKEAVGLDFRSVFQFVNEKGEAYKEEQRPFVRVLRERKVIRDTQSVLVTRSNKRASLHISVSPLWNEEKTALVGAVGVFRDVSVERSEERKRAEFISTASHEMRTPVAAIEGYLALAMNNKVCTIDSKARSYLEKAHLSTQHLGQLFQDLLTSAKAEDGRLSSHPTMIELGAFLEGLTDDLKFAAEKKGLSMEFVIGSGGETIDASSHNNKMVRPLYYAFVDPDRIREVITNLFDNAVKYTDTGKISIGLTGDNNIVQFYIRDTGPGIPPEDVSHLFQKFYRVDNSATRTIGGTGLGLFICRKIVELYSGQIWVESKLQKGSTFYVNLPRVESAKAQQIQQQTATQASPLDEASTLPKS